MYHINKESIGNGENITLQNTAKYYFKKFDILGNSKQETREGYNILPITLKSQTQKGVTITVKEDGSITLNGTSTEGFSITFSQTSIVLNGDYIFYLFGKSSRINFQGYENGNAVAYLKFSDTNQSVTKKFSTDTTITNLFCYINANTVFNNETFKFMITKGTEDKPYEQYGATPSIEFESPIESVGDNINELANLIETQTINGVEITKNINGSLTFNGTVTNDLLLNLNKENDKYFNAISGETYTISLQNNNGLYFRLRRVDENINIASFDTPTSKITFTSNYSGNCFAYLVMKAGTTFNKLTIYPKLEKGSKATPYSPYGQGSIEIYNCNKNLLNMGNNTFVSNGLNMVNEITKITVTGTLTSSWATASKSTSCFLKAGTYTFSIDKPLTHHIYLELTFEDGTTTALQINRNTLSKQITTDKNIIKYNVGFSGVTSGTTYNETIYLQLEKGTEATGYVEHQNQIKSLITQQPFRAIGDVKDKFVKKDGVWYEEHNIGRYIVTGNESWQLRNNGSNTADNQIALFSLSNPFNYQIYDNNKYAFSNYFEIAESIPNIDRMYSKNTCISFHSSSKVIYINTIIADTLEIFKAKLTELYNAGTPLYVDYSIVTPTLIECTPEQVEVLESFNTYKNVTNISSDSIGELEVTYSKDLETLYNNLSQAILGGN